LDALASGGVDAEGNLKKITYALESEVGVTEDEIAGLADLLDTDKCNPEFLIFISATLGTLIGAEPSLGETRARWMVRNLVSFYKIKGTQLSWRKRFLRHFNSGELSFWYRAWELWKSIPYEIGNYSRYLDYTHQLRAARYDLYYLDGEGNPVFLSPHENRALLPYITDIRPIHVLPRMDVILEEVRDVLSPVTESVEITTQVQPIDAIGVLEADVAVETSCVSQCETSCEGWCETTCEGAACEVVCQAFCESQSEINICELDCASACEGGACEGGCQVGSCQSGCQTCAEVEVFPAYVVKVDYSTDAYQMYGIVVPLARIWYPAPGLGFPPTAALEVNWQGSDYWITLPGEKKVVTFSPVGKGTYSATNPSEHTLIPAIVGEVSGKPGSWILVRCIKGEEFKEVHALKGNGVNKYWSGKLGYPPHPCSVRVEAELVAIEVTLAANVAAGAKVITVSNASSFNTGDQVQIRDANHAETNQILSKSGNKLSLRCPTRFSYTAALSGKVIRPIRKQVIHTQMVKPVNANTWYGEAIGDVDFKVSKDARRINYRGAYEVSVTFKDPPPKGATITVYYVREVDCKYAWVVTPQTIEGGTLLTTKSTIKQGWLFVDEDGKEAHGDPRNEKVYVPPNSCMPYPACDARGHIIGWWYYDQGWQWYSPWGFAEPTRP
jgi:hypothetical protein